jgi:NTP pyrophosphatase (non-canonical NTP hydrolase)
VPINDSETTVDQLKEIVEAFASARDWEIFHTPKNLVMSLAIETAELMEHFQWLTPEQSLEVKNDPDHLTKIGEEAADVLSYLLALTNRLDIDLSQALKRKMKLNEAKYPVEKYKGRFGPDDPTPVS